MLAEEGRNSIFCKIQAEADNPNGAVDSEDVELEAIALLVAGTDTTAVTLTYLVWAVLLRPDLQDQLEAEVATLPQNYTDSDVESLTLLNAVIHETLRLYGAVPGGLPRIVPEGGVDSKPSDQQHHQRSSQFYVGSSLITLQWVGFTCPKAPRYPRTLSACTEIQFCFLDRMSA